MRRFNMISALIVSLILFASLVQSQDLTNLELIAHYPLSSTANDTTGNYAPMELTNTPFRDGGIYCNGIYPDGSPNACDAVTPDISGLNSKSFAVSADFKIDSLLNRRPILMCGDYYRWSIIFTDEDDSTISLSQSSALFNAHTSDARFSLNIWHEIIYVYDSTANMGWLYLDGVAIDSSDSPLDDNNDRTFTITHGGEGRTFKGYLKDLKVYSMVDTPTLLQQDSLALVALYDSTVGANWKNNDNWLTGPVETWYGITVEGGRVTLVDLDYNNLTRHIPPQIGNLAYIEKLYLHDNHLCGTIPAEFGNFKNLLFLDFHDNQFEGSIPAELANMQALRHLSIQNNFFSELPDLSAMSALERLRVQDNRFTFEDLEPNIGIADFIYSPQDSVGAIKDTMVTEGTNLNFSVTVGGTANLYQWYKNGVKITDSDSCFLSISTVTPSDSGLYTCRITNTIASALTLHSRPVSVHVMQVSGVSKSKKEIPARFTLFQNYPNPFNPETRIDYYLPIASTVRLQIYDVRGRVVRKLIQGNRSAGFHSVVWDSRNRNGRKVAAGIYLCRLETMVDETAQREHLEIRKMVLIK